MHKVRFAALGLILALTLILTPAILAQGPQAEVAVYVPYLVIPNSKIAFAEYDLEPGLYTLASNGNNRRRLTSFDMNIANPAWSPHGGRIAFQSNFGAYWDIYVINADGTGLTNLTNSPQEESAPQWSPDGSRITFSQRDHLSSDIMIMDADGANKVNITSSDAWESEPIWSPDGERLAYYCPGWHGSSNRDICVMKTDGSQANNLTKNESTEGDISWSPDGASILFDSYRAGNRDIYRVPEHGGNQVRLTDRAGEDYHAAWSPDGRSIVYVSYPVGAAYAELTVMNANGSNKRVIHSDPDYLAEPAWSPDGRSILFTRSDNLDRVTVDDGQLLNLTHYPEGTRTVLYPIWSTFVQP